MGCITPLGTDRVGFELSYLLVSALLIYIFEIGVFDIYIYEYN
jgi:hypothetical protein